MEPVVRLTRPGDINSVTAIDLKCYHYPLPMKEWQALINGSGKQGQARIVVTEVYRASAGFAMWSVDEDRICNLHRVGVLPKFRRNGLGTVLVAACVRHCFETNKTGKEDLIKTARVVVPDIHCSPGDPDDVSAFLSSCDFKPTGKIIPEFKTMYGQPVDGYVFERGTNHAVTIKR